MLEIIKFKYKVQDEIHIPYDSYQDGSYIRSKFVSLKKGDVVKGSKIMKGDKQFILFDAKDFGVNENIEIPIEKVKFLFPWKETLITAGVIILIWGAAKYLGKKKK